MSSRHSCSYPCSQGIGLRGLTGERLVHVRDSPVGASVGGEGHVWVSCLALCTHASQALTAVALSQRIKRAGHKGLTCAVWIRFMHIVAPSMPEGPVLSFSLAKAPQYS